MKIVIVLSLFMLAALILVSLLHQMQRKEQLQRIKQRRLRIQIEELSEVIHSVEQTVGDKLLLKKLNDIVISFLESMRSLERKASPYVESALQKSSAYAEKLANPEVNFKVRYERDSDAQINRTQQQLMAAITLLANIASQGKLTEDEYESYQNQLGWAHLMVPVTSFVAQANKCSMKHDRATAQAFFQRALQYLIDSPHPNPKRTQLIREINEMLEGDRTSFSEELLMPGNMIYQDLDSI